MTNILEVRSGVTGANSVSNMLADEAVRMLLRAGDQLRVRDLDTKPVPHISSQMIAALGREVPIGERALAHRALSDELIEEVFEADCIVLSVPMYNYGIPSTLKAWFDHIIRAGVTFEYSPTGPVGRLGGKCAIVCSGRGASYLGDTQPLDCVGPHLRAMLGLVGITDIEIVAAEGLQMGEKSREDGMAAAQNALAAAISNAQASLG